MIGSLAIIAVGVFLSAFFSGSETGFYRIARVRLAMDAKSGSWIARSLLWLVAHPNVVVVNVLIGNNIANYLVSLGLVFLSQQLLQDMGGSLQAILPVLATPFLFIYGELLPKYLYYNAPYKLSVRGAPLMLLCAGVFLPISLIVFAVEVVWRAWFGGQPAGSGQALQRQGLQQVLLEGQEAGILLPVQREMAQNLFTYGARPLRQFAVPVQAIPAVDPGASVEAMLGEARRFKQKLVAVRSADGSGLDHCLRTADLLVLAEAAPKFKVARLKANASNVEGLMQMRKEHTPLAEIYGAQGQVLGLVSQDRLMARLLFAD